jgi:hypothetical protein
MPSHDMKTALENPKQTNHQKKPTPLSEKKICESRRNLVDPASAVVRLEKNGTPVGSRTPNLLIRSQALYPIELRVRQ